ncbi:MAG: shikimate kinase [Clostridia bacterium]
MKNNIALIGFMGTGKTAVGKELARILQIEFFDTDKLVEQRMGKSITAAFADQGEAYFRAVESKVVQELAKKTNAVISTGGGVVLDQKNMKALQKSCFVVCLQAAPETIYARTTKQKERPLLKGEHPLTKIQTLLASRKQAYEQADLKIATDEQNVQQIAALICAAYKRSEKNAGF